MNFTSFFTSTSYIINLYKLKIKTLTFNEHIPRIMLKKIQPHMSTFISRDREKVISKSHRTRTLLHFMLFMILFKVTFIIKWILFLHMFHSTSFALWTKKIYINLMMMMMMNFDNISLVFFFFGMECACKKLLHEWYELIGNEYKSNEGCFRI